MKSNLSFRCHIQNAFSTTCLFLCFRNETIYCQDWIVPRQPTDAEYKAVDLLINHYQFVLTVIGACIAFLLYNHKEFKKIFSDSGKCFAKAIAILCGVSFVCAVCFLLWNQQTLINQLQNGLIYFEDVLSDTWYLVPFASGLISFTLITFHL